jgi:hypothetical protein
MGIVEFLEERDAMVDPSVHDILDQRPGADAYKQNKHPQTRSLDVPMRECQRGERDDPTEQATKAPN